MKKSALLICLASVLAAAFIQSCALIIPTGVTEDKTWDLSAFDKVIVDNAFSATVNIGTGWSVTTRTDTALTRYLDLKVVGTTLYVTVVPTAFTGVGMFTLSADITLPSLSSLTVNGASSVDLGPVSGSLITLATDDASTLNTSSVTAQSVTLNAAGASTLEMDSVVSSTFTANAIGASGIIIHSGNLGTANLAVSGASSFTTTAGQVTSGNVSVNVTGASNASFDTTGTVTGTVTGASNVTIGGTPVSQAGLVTDDASHVYRR